MNQEQVKNAIKHGSTLELAGAGQLLNGARVKAVRMSNKTANVSCELVEDWESFHKGDPVHVPCYELSYITPRPHERAQEYQDAIDSASRTLHRIVEKGVEARKKFASDILKDQTAGVEYLDLLVDQVRWGYGVEADIKATHARRILAYAMEVGLEQALAAGVVELERALAHNQWGGGSSSAYSNAVDETRRSAGRDLVRDLTFELREIRKTRAMIEVL